jgi:hypothetical protein
VREREREREREYEALFLTYVGGNVYEYDDIVFLMEL